MTIRLARIEKAIRWDEWVTAEKLLKEANFGRDTQRYTFDLLMLALEMGRTKFIELLISNGADVDGIGNKYNKFPIFKCPLHFACNLGNEEAMKILLKMGADVEVRNSENRTVLEEAIQGDKYKPELVNLLLTHGAIIHEPLMSVMQELTILYTIKKTPSKLTVPILQRHGVSWNTSDKIDDSHYWLAFIEDIDTVRMLVECGAPLGPKTLSNMPPLAVGIVKGNPDWYEWLEAQLSSPSSLKCHCARSIRMHLAKTHERSVLKHLAKLPLPKRLIEYLALDRYLPPAMGIFNFF